jgi:hypothetical protein
MAVLAVGLACLGMASGCLTATSSAGAVEGDQPTDHLLGLAAPDAVLLAGPHCEREAVVADQAGRADGDGLGLEFGAVGEGRGRSRPTRRRGRRPGRARSDHSCHNTPGARPARLAWLAVGASAGRRREGSCGVWELLRRASRAAAGGRTAPGMAAELAAGRVGTGRRPAGACGTGSAVNPLVRGGVLGSCGTGRDAAPTAHNPEVEGSNPSPATKLTRAFATTDGRPSGTPRAECSRLAHASRRRAVAEDQAGHRLGRLRVQARQDMRVGIQRDLDGRMAQALAHDLGRDAGR